MNRQAAKSATAESPFSPLQGFFTRREIDVILRANQVGAARRGERSDSGDEFLEQINFRESVDCLADDEYTLGLLTAHECIAMRQKIELLSRAEICHLMATVARYWDNPGNPADVGLFGEEDLSAREMLFAHSAIERRLATQTEVWTGAVHQKVRHEDL